MVSVILPTYNERENLGILIDGLLRKISVKKEIIVIDDNSPDRTWEVAQEIGKKFPEVKVIRRIKERGLVSALRRGIKEAKGEIISWMDCDLSMPPEVLRRMIEKIDTYDVVVASRFFPGGKDERAPSYPYFFSRLINLLCQIFLYRDFHDYTSGFIAVKRGVTEKILLQGDYGEYFISLIVQSKKKGYKVLEIPYICQKRKYGKTKTSPNLSSFLRKGVKYLLMLKKGLVIKWEEKI